MQNSSLGIKSHKKEDMKKEVKRNSSGTFNKTLKSATSASRVANKTAATKKVLSSNLKGVTSQKSSSISGLNSGRR